MRTPPWVLPVIVISQFFCTSLWFAGNAVLPDIVLQYALDKDFLAHITSAVQFGFITGTFVFALLSISDRFSPSKVFFISALLAGLLNVGITMPALQSTQLLLFRFSTGFFLAGVYPVGMKIASDHYSEGLGRSLGFLVGALVLGTAFPHLLKSVSITFPWQYVVYTTSALSLLGGVLVLLFLPDGPYRKTGGKFDLTAFLKGFAQPGFRSVALGYFGHMWELYTFWAFVPLMLAAFNQHNATALNVPLFSFLVIASGSVACVLGGILSQHFGAKRIAAIALALSGCCCIASPLLLFTSSVWLFLGFLFFWAIVVIADSPLFSSLLAKNAPAQARGSSLTIVNCIGFSITIISIQFLNMVSGIIDPRYMYMLLAIGPILGLFAFLNNRE